MEQLQKDPSTRYSDQGVIPIDNTLIDRDGMLIPDAGWYWDHAEQRNKIAQDYLFINYVCTSGKHYPLEFRLFRKEEVCTALKEPFRNHTKLCCELIDWVCERQHPRRLRLRLLLHQRRGPQPHPREEGPVRAAPGLCRRPEDQPQAGVEGPDHQGQRPGGLDPGGGPQGDADRRPPPVVLHGDGAHPRREAQGAGRHPVALPPGRACCKVLVTNRITWEVSRIVRVYRHRWTGTETFHRDGKQQLGLGDCQLRDVQGQTRHMYLVMLAYSLLMGELKQGRAREWALHRLMTIGEACRAMTREALRTTLSWAIEQVTEGEPGRMITS